MARNNRDINHKDIKRAIMAQDVAQQMNDFVVKETDVKNQNKIIEKYVHSNPESASKLVDRLLDSERRDEIIHRFSDYSSDEKIYRINTKMKKTQQSKRIKSIVRSISSVAAVLISISVLLIYTTNYKANEGVVSTQIGDITNFSQITKPTIITENGEKVELELITEVKNAQHYRVEPSKRRVDYRDGIGANDLQEKKNELIVPPHNTYTIVLSDGSEITLNAGSRLKYPVNFVGNSRTVELYGEAFFKIVKSERPFIVKAEDVSIKVYGTSFNVNILSDKIETVLVEGEVAVYSDDCTESRMKPNQLTVFDKNKALFTAHNVDATEYIRWMEGDFDYRERLLEDVLNDLSRWYHIEFESMINLKGVRISLYSPREIELKDVLDLIEMSKDIKFIKEKEGHYRIER